MSGKLAREIKQTKPFGSAAEEAILNVQRTAALLGQAMAEALKPYGLSETQYNALRILRGAGPKGLACQEIGERMITRDPDITRLLDRLGGRELIERARSEEDRRVVVVRITAAGLKLLSSLDAAARELPKQALGHLGERRLRLLIDLLERARSAPDE
ncbi:MAG: MarR family transcriptional regulator [Planctomycetes bacterium]|nr:MarR family transcriptional regulator [Planctomycetota bacterium]